MKADLVIKCSVCRESIITSTYDGRNWKGVASELAFHQAHRHREHWQEQYEIEKRLFGDEFDDQKEDDFWHYNCTRFSANIVAEDGQFIDPKDPRIFNNQPAHGTYLANEGKSTPCEPSRQPNSFFKQHMEWSKEEEG